MTKEEVKKIRAVLLKVTPKDGRVMEAIASCDRLIAQYVARQGQLIEQYDYDGRW